MNPRDTTARGQTAIITMEFELPHAPATVWRALTEPRLLAEWLLPVTGFEFAPGTTFSFNAPPQPGWDGIVHCRMLAVDAPRSIRYAWVVGELRTEVSFTLTPTSSGTLLSLVHSGFKANQKQNFGGAIYGWKLMGQKLVDMLARGAR